MFFLNKLLPVANTKYGEKNSGNDEDDQDTEQHRWKEFTYIFSKLVPRLTSTASEVNLGLESEKREGEGDGRGGPHGHQHRVGRVEGGDGAQHEALTH